MSDATTPTATGEELVTVVEIIDTLEELVTTGRRVPFTPSVVVNEEETLELIDRVRVALPDDLVEARHTLEERDRLLERAEREASEVVDRARQDAERIVREAHELAATLVDQHALLRTANEQAAELVAEAERQATSERTAADDYARDVMQQLEDQLAKTLATVRQGLEALPRPAAETGRRRRR